MWISPGVGFGYSVRAEKERSVPIHTDVAGAIQTYLLAERPETRLMHCSSSLRAPITDRVSAAGLRTVFRMRRERSVSAAGIHTPCGIRSAPHWPRPGCDLSVIQALMGHEQCPR